MAIKLNKDMSRFMKQLNAFGMEEAVKQYKESEEYWVTSSGDDEYSRRSFVTAYEEPLEQLWNYREGLVKEKNPELENFDAYLKENGFEEMLKDYQWMIRDRSYEKETKILFHERMNKTDAPGKDSENYRSGYVASSPLDDPTLTPEQRTGLKEFHKWLYRNCDRRTGIYLLGAEGGARGFAEEFMKKPASVQLKALYLLETKNRKKEDQDVFDLESQVSYVPNLKKLKDQMIATNWKAWRHAYGTHYYWNKLRDSVQMAEKHADKLEAFRSEQNQQLQNISMEDNPAKLEEAKNEHRELFAGRAAVAFMKKSPLTRSLEQAIGQYKTGNKKQMKDLISEQVQAITDQSYLKQEMDRQSKESKKQSEHAASFANTKTTADRTSGRINKVSGLVGKFNKVVKYGKKVAKYIPPAKKILAKVNKVTPYTNRVGTLLGMINSSAKLTAISKRNKNFNKVLENHDVDDPRLKSLAELGKKLNKVERKQNIGNLISGGYFTASGIYSMLSLGIPFVGPILSGISFVTSYGKMIYDKNLINRKRHTTIVDHELLGGEDGINDKINQYDKKLEERQKRYPSGSKQYKAIADMRANKHNMKDRLRKDHVAKDGNVHLSDSYQKQLKKIRQEIFSQIYYVDPKKKENPEYITDSNYSEHYKEDTKEYRKRASYQELLRGFKHRRQDFKKLKSKEDVQKLESRVVKGK